MELRYYQREAIEAVYEHLRTWDNNPCVVIPTGGGKTPVISTICRDAVQEWGGRVLVLAHVKELLEQSVESIRRISPTLDVGLYSAGLKRRDTKQPVLVAGIQSIYQRACDFEPFDLVIVDEAHLIPEEGEGMYRRFIADAQVVNPNLRVVGMTATPYRLKSGMICTRENILNHVCYEVSVKELIVKGYLSRLIGKSAERIPDLSCVHVKGGEYLANEMEEAFTADGVVVEACKEIHDQTKDRRSVLIFTSGIEHGNQVYNLIKNEYKESAAFITGETPSRERAAILHGFKQGHIKYLVNVNVLTTGFDAPNVDCVVLLRATLSPGLYYQMVGRGFRLHEGKENCLVLDFGENIVRHGPVDRIKIKNKKASEEPGEAPGKVCENCRAVVAAGYAMCPECGAVFPERALKHDSQAGSESPLSGNKTTTVYIVKEIRYDVHYKKGADGEELPRTMKVSYKINMYQWVREWICVEHTGIARRKAEIWWESRCIVKDTPCPDNADTAVEMAQTYFLATPTRIIVEQSPGEYDRVIGYEYDEPETPNNLTYSSDIPF